MLIMSSTTELFPQPQSRETIHFYCLKLSSLWHLYWPKETTTAKNISVVVIESGFSFILGKHPTTRLHFQPSFYFLFKKSSPKLPTLHSIAKETLSSVSESTVLGSTNHTTTLSSCVSLTYIFFIL